jgi:tight adherence protein C
MVDQVAQNSVVRAVLLLFVFAAVALGSYFATHRAVVRQAARRRLPDTSTGSFTVETIGSLRSQRVESAWLKLVNSIEKSGVSLVDTNDEALRTKLIAAGFPGAHAPRVYTLVRLLSVIGLPTLVFSLIWLSGATLSIVKLYFLLLPAALIGLYGPSLFIRIRADRRRQELINAFPDALDLMLVCVEAGLGLEAAFSRVGMEMMTSHPLLTEQFGTVVLELRAGRNHDEAFRRMADRAGSDEIRAFATLLIQSTRLGSSISQTLRVYANEMRVRRRLKAEERAHRLPVLISIPLVACMLPTMIGILMLPAAIRVARTVVPTLHGG